MTLFDLDLAFEPFLEGFWFEVFLPLELVFLGMVKTQFEMTITISMRHRKCRNPCFINRLLGTKAIHDLNRLAPQRNVVRAFAHKTIPQASK
jgi:hypothetical protein